MNDFDFWQHWGVELSDLEFANMWVALGIAAAAGTRRGAPRDLVGQALERARKSGHQVPWTFPPTPAGRKGRRTSSARSRASSSPLAATPPREWALAWSEAPPLGTQGDPTRARLRLLDAPPDESAPPWLCLLAEARPRLAAISFRVPATRALPRVAWPMRLGHLPGNAGLGLIEAARQNWPSNEHTRVLALGRERANCDILVYAGTTRTLLRELLGRPESIKANMVLLHGGESGEWGEVSARLASIMAEVRGSGYALVRGDVDGNAVAAALNSFVVEVSHARPLDVALYGGFQSVFRDPHQADLVAGFTDGFANFTLPELARTMNRRMREMPRGSRVDLSRLGNPEEWLTRGVRGEGVAGGGLTPVNFRPDADRRVTARSVRIERNALEFDHESAGASVLARVNEAMARADVPDAAQQARAARFLQQQSFVRPRARYEPATHGFLAETPALVRVRIGPPDEQWNALAAEFPVERLPEHVEQWTLTVWLGEPDHLPAPIKARIKLPRDGSSTECEFRFRPKSLPRFEGRITVLHRGRVLQTAVLRASVVSPDGNGGRPPALEELIPVHQGIGELDQRRKFDLALVLNHDGSGRPLLTGLSENHAWISDLTQSVQIAKDINARLSPVAKSVADYADGLDGEKGRALLVQLAQAGRWLHLYLVEQQLGAAGNRADIAAEEYVQIVSTRSDAVIPFEFIYEFETPDDDATLCPNWKESLRSGRCPNDAEHTSGKRVCPLGFWGLSKVIERHALTPELARDGQALYLQSEPGRNSDTLRLGGRGVFGASSRVPMANLTPLAEALAETTGLPPAQASDWESWATLVHDQHPTLLFALAHTDGTGVNVSLELGGKTIKSIQIKREHVVGDPAGQMPLVALLGCDTTGTASDYGQHVAVFRARGAAIVIGTIATVFGEHAAMVAKQLVMGLLDSNAAPPFRLGEVLLALKRQALLDQLLMPLCLVAYGDADWKLAK